MSEEGFFKAKGLFERYFIKETATLPFPELTLPAKKRWEQLDKIYDPPVTGGVETKLLLTRGPVLYRHFRARQKEKCLKP